jgi:hypothetical protein
MRGGDDRRGGGGGGGDRYERRGGDDRCVLHYSSFPLTASLIDPFPNTKGSIAATELSCALLNTKSVLSVYSGTH